MFARYSVSRVLMPVVMAALVVSGCATMVPEDSEKWRDSQTPVLRERSEMRWDALVKGDFEKVYSYLSPDYRAVVTLQQYRGKFGRALEWRVARAYQVNYDSPTVASVSVEVAYRVGLPPKGEVIETKKFLTEKWLYKDGEWWYTVQ